MTHYEHMRAALTELVRLKLHRDELGQREKAGTIDLKELKKALLIYGREKNAAWEVACAVLAIKGERNESVSS